MRPSSGHGKDGAAPPARPVVAMRSQQPVSEAASPPAARGRNSATTEGRSDGLTWAPRYHFVAPPSTRPDTAPSYNPPAAPPFALVNRSTASGATGARVGIPGPVPSSSMLQSRVATRFSGDGLNPAALGAPASASPTPRSRSMPMHHERVATPGATGTSGSRGAGLSTVGGHSRPWALPSPKGILKKSQQVPPSRSAEVGSTPLGVATSPRRVRFNEGSLMDSGMGASHVYSDDALGMSLDHVNLEEVMQERDSSLVTSSKLVAATGQWGEDSEWFNAQFGVSSPPKSAPVSTTKSAGRSVASSSGAPRSQPPNGGQLPSPSKSGSGGGSLKESSSSYVDGLTESERRFIKTLILVNQRHSMRSGSSASSREPSMSTSSPVLPHGPGMNTSLLEDNWSTSRPASGGTGARRHSYQSGESSLERTRSVTVPRSSTSNGTRGTDSVAIRGSTSTVEPSVLIMTPRGTYLGDEAAPLAEVRRSTQSRMLSSASSLEEEGPRRQVPQPFPHGGR